MTLAGPSTGRSSATRSAPGTSFSPMTMKSAPGVASAAARSTRAGRNERSPSVLSMRYPFAATAS